MAALNEGKNLLSEHNKHILLAEKFGWDAVQCFATEPLAKDANNEKRIKKAVKESQRLRDEKKNKLMPVIKSKRAYSWANAPSEQKRGVAGHHISQQPDFRRESLTCRVIRALRVFVASDQDTSRGSVGQQTPPEPLHLMECSLEQLRNGQPPSEWEKDNFINHINHETSNVGDLFETLFMLLMLRTLK